MKKLVLITFSLLLAVVVSRTGLYALRSFKEFRKPQPDKFLINNPCVPDNISDPLDLVRTKIYLGVSDKCTK